MQVGLKGARATLVASWLIVVTCGAAAESVRSSSPRTPRRFAEIKAEVQATMRIEAMATDSLQRYKAVRHLATLLSEVSHHPHTMTAPFRRTALRIRIRLLRVQRTLDKAHPASAITEHRAERPQIATPITTLSQQIGAGVGGSVAGVPANPVIDDGAALLELIERTVQRDVWVSQGGNSSISYFPPSHALVISAPASVHDDVAALLIMLRAAGP